MTMAAAPSKQVPWWKEPTKDQWLAWIAAWMGWTLDSFDFTVFLLIMVSIAKDFDVPMTQVALLFTFTLWLRLVGATGSGWLADRVGRKGPLMISILGYSLCNFIAGFSPTFMFLFFFRALLGIFMGAEWPAGASLAMESWPTRSRGFMSGILQGSWNLGFALSALCYGFLYNSIGWRGLLMLGILPALACVYIRFFVKEPEVWLENRKLQREQEREARVPLFKIFKRGMLGNTLTACWWMASGFVVYYSVFGMFATYLQRDLKLPASSVFEPILIANIVGFVAMGFWGWVADKWGRRWSMIIPAAIGAVVAPFYLMTSDFATITIFFAIQAAFAGAIYGQNPSYLSERFPTEVRGTEIGFCYHQGAIFGGAVPTVITFFAVDHGMGFATPMLIGTSLACVSFVLALLCGPETKGQEMTAELQVV
jgi:SHS family lactate transporter-like MFS transporter